MKSYFLIEVWAESKFSPIKAETGVPWHFPYWTAALAPPVQGAFLFKHLVHHIMCFCKLILVFVTSNLGTPFQIWELEKDHSFNCPQGSGWNQGFKLSFNIYIQFEYWISRNIPQVQKEICSLPNSSMYNSQFIFFCLTLNKGKAPDKFLYFKKNNIARSKMNKWKVALNRKNSLLLCISLLFSHYCHTHDPTKTHVGFSPNTKQFLMIPDTRWVSYKPVQFWH